MTYDDLSFLTDTVSFDTDVTNNKISRFNP